MKPVLLALVVAIAYAMVNHLTERHLRNFAALQSAVMVAVGVAIMGGVALLMMYFSGTPIETPTRTQWWAIAACALVLVIGEYCYFAAYTSGGTAMTVSTILLIVPVLAGIITLFVDGRLPNLLSMLGWVVVAIGVLIVTYAAQQNPPH